MLSSFRIISSSSGLVEKRPYHMMIVSRPLIERVNGGESPKEVKRGIQVTGYKVEKGDEYLKDIR